MLRRSHSVGYHEGRVGIRRSEVSPKNNVLAGYLHLPRVLQRGIGFGLGPQAMAVGEIGSTRVSVRPKITRDLCTCISQASGRVHTRYWSETKEWLPGGVRVRLRITAERVPASDRELDAPGRLFSGERHLYLMG